MAAHDRGVAVRVLVDQDREDDPYRSTVINSPAKKYLEEHSVPCRFDTSDRLLHSKFLVVDWSAIVGSHNWSAGSYSGFDDLSLVVRSAQLVAALSSRFDALWGA